MSPSPVTVIVTCYREGQLLERALQSVAKQTRAPREIIIVNDNSPCEVTNAICRIWSNKPSVRLVVLPRNGGLSAARNRGFKEATTEWCMFLDGDDELPEDAVLHVSSGIECNPEADFLFGNYLRVDTETGETHPVDCKELCGPDGWLVPARLLHRWILSGHTPCRRRVWQGVGGYAARFSFGYQDVDFYMRALSRGFRGRFLNELIYRWHRSNTGMNQQRRPRQLYYRAYSWNYYETLGGDSTAWIRIVQRYLDERREPNRRAEARELMFRLCPTRLDRIPVYLRFLLMVCTPLWFDKMISRGPSSVSPS